MRFPRSDVGKSKSQHTQPAGFVASAGDCDDTDPAVHPGATELCDGIDDDCDASIDEGIPTPAGVPVLSESKSGTTALLSWSPLPGVTGYDVVAGSLAALQASGGDFETSTTACLGNDQPATTEEDAAVPAPGAGSWYLVRAVNACGGNGTYDESAPSQQGSRDAEILASGAACP